MVLAAKVGTAITAGTSSSATRSVTTRRGSTFPDSNSRTTSASSRVALRDPRIVTSLKTICRASSGTSPFSQARPCRHAALIASRTSTSFAGGTSPANRKAYEPPSTTAKSPRSGARMERPLSGCICHDPSRTCSRVCRSRRRALPSAASRTWRRLQGENQLPKVIRGVKFRDGIEVSVPTSHSAA